MKYRTRSPEGSIPYYRRLDRLRGKVFSYSQPVTGVEMYEMDWESAVSTDRGALKSPNISHIAEELEQREFEELEMDPEVALRVMAAGYRGELEEIV